MYNENRVNMKRILQHVPRLLLAVFFLWIVPVGVWGQTDKWNGSTFEAPDGWSTGDKEVTITKASELAWIAQTTNDGTVTGLGGETGFEGCTIKLNTDIDLDSKEWPIIGYSGAFKFKGYFDGQGFRVKNLKIDIDGQGDQNIYAGLFGYLTEATIQNLGIVISGNGLKAIARRKENPTDAHIGGLAGAIYSSTIQNCYVTGGSIFADMEDIGDGGASIYIGGLIALSNASTIQYCYSIVNIHTGHQYSDNNNVRVGGLVGQANTYTSPSSIANCFTSGSIDTQTFGKSDNSYIGGICGRTTGSTGAVTISNCVTLVTIMLIKERRPLPTAMLWKVPGLPLLMQLEQQLPAIAVQMQHQKTGLIGMETLCLQIYLTTPNGRLVFSPLCLS